METINEFIETLNSKAELEKERAFYDAVKWNHITAYGEYCRKLEAEYRQLAEWLKELQVYRNNLTNQSLSDALVHSENENERLHDRVNELSKEVQAHRYAWAKLREDIRDEAEFAYADFDEYKYEVLGIDDVDDLPNDDYRYGMERALELIDIYRPKEGDIK